MPNTDRTTNNNATDLNNDGDHKEHMAEIPNINRLDRRQDFKVRDRPAREREALLLIAAGIKEEFPDRPASQVNAEAKRQYDRLTRHSPGVLKWMSKLAAESGIPDRALLNTRVELAAVMDLPEINWAFKMFQLAKGGRPANRALPMSLFIDMACQRQTPELLATLDTSKDSRTREMVYGDVGNMECDLDTIYGTMHQMLREQQDPDVWRHINIALLKRLKANDPEGYHDLGMYLMVDGSLLRAPVPQRPAKGGAGSDHDRMLRRKCEMAAFIAYDDKICRGYKVMLIADAVHRLPLVWKLCESTCNEREVTLELLAELHSLWPELAEEHKDRFLVGDTAYNMGKNFVQDVEFRWNIHPVFHHGREIDPAAGLPWTDRSTDRPGQLGVPKCAHGLMEFHCTEGFPNHKKRTVAGLDYGEPYPVAEARVRWNCPAGGGCTETTRPVEDPRFYTWVQRAGDHKRADLRRALYLKRNSVESIFAEVKGSGKAGGSHAVAAWATDPECEHLLGARFTFMAARRLVHQTNAYQAKLEQYEAADADLAALGRFRPASVAPTTWRPRPAELAGYCAQFRADDIRAAYDGNDWLRFVA